MRLATLKKRSEFLRVRGGGRYSGPAFVMEGVKRSGNADGARFGFTITKKLGGAVVRNRMRRRLKAALSEVAAEQADSAFDYVIVARPPALDRSFVDLRTDFLAAFERIRRARAGGKSRTDGSAIEKHTPRGDRRTRSSSRPNSN